MRLTRTIDKNEIPESYIKVIAEKTKDSIDKFNGKSIARFIFALRRCRDIMSTKTKREVFNAIKTKAENCAEFSDEEIKRCLTGLTCFENDDIEDVTGLISFFKNKTSCKR